MELNPSWETKRPSHTLNKFPAFYGTLRLITVFTRSLPLVPILIKTDPFLTLRPISTMSILISSHLRLSLHICLFPSVFLPTLCMHSSCPARNLCIFKMLHTFTRKWLYTLPRLSVSFEVQSMHWCLVFHCTHRCYLDKFAASTPPTANPMSSATVSD